jgi:putative tryptophan/tyrosine transport system substrate-binding protein
VAIGKQQIGALFVSADPLFLNERDKLVALTARHVLPAIYAERELAEAGGLMSYGASRTEAYRIADNYVGRILKGEKPGNLPVQQSTKFDVLNLKTAKSQGLVIPPSIFASAHEVIE